MSRLLVFLDYEEGGAIVLPQLSTACLPRILRPHLNLAKPTSSACSLKVLLHMLMPYLRIRPMVLPVTLQPRESLPNFLGWECSCFFILMAILNVFLRFCTGLWFFLKNFNEKLSWIKLLHQLHPLKLSHLLYLAHYHHCHHCQHQCNPCEHTTNTGYKQKYQ